MSPFILVGQSHGRALRQAAQEDGRPVRPFIGRPESGIPGLHKDGAFSVELLDALRSGAPVLSCIGGNSHTRMALIRFERPFDFVLSEAPHLPLEPGAELLSELALHLSLKRRMTAHRGIMRAVAAEARGRIFHAELPPPALDTPEFRASIGALGEGEPAPNLLRYKIWRLHSAIAAETCAELGMVFMPSPPQAADAAGFLRQEYLANATHANAAYGKLVWRQLDDLL